MSEIAGLIEDKLFDLHKDITPKYKMKYRSLLFNLKDTKNQVNGGLHMCVCVYVRVCVCVCVGFSTLRTPRTRLTCVCACVCVSKYNCYWYSSTGCVGWGRRGG